MKRYITLAIAIVLVLLCGLQITADGAIPLADCYHYYQAADSYRYNHSSIDWETHSYDENTTYKCVHCQDIYVAFSSGIEGHSFTLDDIIPYPDGECWRYSCHPCGYSYDQYMG